MTDILDEARAAVNFVLEFWAGDEPPEHGSCVEVLQRMILEVEQLRCRLQAIDKANELGVYAVPQRWGKELWWLARTPDGHDLPYEVLQRTSHLGRYGTIEEAIMEAAQCVDHNGAPAEPK